VQTLRLAPLAAGDNPLATTVALQLQDNPPKAVAARRRAWLGC
jgi:hypothetical protein